MNKPMTPEELKKKLLELVIYTDEETCDQGSIELEDLIGEKKVDEIIELTKQQSQVDLKEVIAIGEYYNLIITEKGQMSYPEISAAAKVWIETTNRFKQPKKEQQIHIDWEAFQLNLEGYLISKETTSAYDVSEWAKNYLERKQQSQIDVTICPLCSTKMNGIKLTHYKCKKCNEYFTD